MSNRLRRMGRFEREEQRRGERWAYIVYGLSADARTDSARLRRIRNQHQQKRVDAILREFRRERATALRHGRSEPGDGRTDGA